MDRFPAVSGAILLAATLCAPALAQDNVETFDFEGGKITITETETGERKVAFDGRLLATNFFASFDREVEVAGSKVALISMGDGGNACGPGTLILWKNGANVDSDYIGKDCGAPEPAITSDRILFVPYLLPGATEDVLSWDPEQRRQLAGRLSYAPQPDTTWGDFVPGDVDDMLTAFANADIYAEASGMLGSGLTDFATSMSVSAGAEKLPGGVIWSSGCVPHACGLSDGFMAVDAANKALFFARQQDKGAPRTWPDAATWPPAIREAMMKAIGPR